MVNIGGEKYVILNISHFIYNIVLSELWPLQSLWYFLVWNYFVVLSIYCHLDLFYLTEKTCYKKVLFWCGFVGFVGSL